MSILLMVTNGTANSCCLPADDAYGRYTFQVPGSRLKSRCAEAAIVHGLDDLIEELAK